MYSDNKSAIQLSKNSGFHRRTKHIDVQYHFTRKAQKDGVVTIHYVPSKEELANIFKKPLNRQLFEMLWMLG